MAASSNFRDMYDVALKPRLLRSLLEEQVPDEKQPSRSPLQLSSIISIIQNHKLLSESFNQTADEKIIKSWKSAVDNWIDRILKLVSSNMLHFRHYLTLGDEDVKTELCSYKKPDKCWAGVCLLGVTCRECSSSRFLLSYSVWLNELLAHIQVSGGSQIVKVASCASTSDIVSRLGGFPNVKKEGTSHAGKLVQPILKLLREDSSESVLEAAAYLLSIIITSFPSSVHRHYDNAEAALVSKIVGGNCSPYLIKKLACCLALLPKSRGDADSWSLMIQKIILAISLQLNDALEGLEEDGKRNAAVMLLVPPGKDPPPQLGGLGEASNMAQSRAGQLLVPTVCALMQCCSTMFTSSFPVQVTVPVRPLLAMIGRVLLVDGSLPRSLLQFTTATQQAFICSQLPVLHMYTLEVLAAMLKGMCSQLLPHAAEIVRLLTEYLKRCMLSEMRIKVYSIIKVLLISMGCGIALYLSQDVINSAFVDLSPVNSESAGTSHRMTFQSSGEATLQPCRKKRKDVTATLLSEEQHSALCVEMGGLIDSSTLSALKIAALEALEALLTVGGASGSDSWRSSVDNLLITVAMDTCRMGLVLDEENSLLLNYVPKATWADLQLAALRALLASLLAPSRARPPHLSISLDLFRRGKQATGTKLAEFCAHALLALELLIHPRALPLIDFPSPNVNTFDGFGGPKQNVPSNGGTLGMGFGDFDADDFVNYDYLEKGDEFEDPMVEGHDAVNPGSEETSKDQNVERRIMDDFSGATALENKGQNHKSSGADVEMQNSDEVPEHPEGPMKRPQESSSRDGVTVFQLVSSSSVAEREVGKASEDGIGGALDFLQRATSGTDIPATIDTADEMLGENMTPTMADPDPLKLSQVELHSESSSDFIPDIVDGDPDSD
ncbi:hypothetical protein Ancab_001200 [Ancistrocladus abbreviatus]